jgi:translation initiation factor 1
MDWKDKLGALKADLPRDEEIQHEAETSNSTVHNSEVKGSGINTNATALSDNRQGGGKSAKQKDPLRVEMDKRKGKPSTLITEFQGSDDELKELAKLLKVKCSSGGSCRDGEILIQGDFRKKIAEILTNLGYKVKRINFN